jgi:hypothetical protein
MGAARPWNSGREVLIGGEIWAALAISERGDRAPVDRVVDGLPQAGVGEQRPVRVQNEKVILGDRIDEVLLPPCAAAGLCRPYRAARAARSCEIMAGGVPCTSV